MWRGDTSKVKHLPTRHVSYAEVPNVRVSHRFDKKFNRTIKLLWLYYMSMLFDHAQNTSLDIQVINNIVLYGFF